MTLSMGLITVLSHLELAQIRISMLRLDSSNLDSAKDREGMQFTEQIRDSLYNRAQSAEAIGNCFMLSYNRQ